MTFHFLIFLVSICITSILLRTMHFVLLELPSCNSWAIPWWKRKHLDRYRIHENIWGLNFGIHRRQHQDQYGIWHCDKIWTSSKWYINCSDRFCSAL